MDITLDCNAINHLSKKGKNGKREADDLTKRILNGLFRVVVDKDRSIVDEWCRTCNAEIVKQLVIKWTNARGFVVLRTHERLPGTLRKRLRDLGFRDAPDQRVLEVARRTTDRTIISSDSDFYDPADPKRIGDSTAPVAKALRDEDDVQVMTLGQLLAG